jgi:hypothetical protein
VKEVFAAGCCMQSGSIRWRPPIFAIFKVTGSGRGFAGKMDDAVRLGRSVPQALEVLDVAILHLGPRCPQSFGAGFRSRQPQHMMPRLSQVEPAPNR